jgi:hypothetical protein
MIDVVLWLVVAAVAVLCVAGIWWAWTHPAETDEEPWL